MKPASTDLPVEIALPDNLATGIFRQAGKSLTNKKANHGRSGMDRDYQPVERIFTEVT